MKITSHFFSLLLLLSFSLVTQAQENSFKILSFTRDNKPIAHYAISFDINGKLYRPRIEGNKVFIPDGIVKSDEVKIKFQAEGYDFSFGPFTGFDNLMADFQVGIDEKPFDEENVSSKDADKIRIAYFLKRIPNATSTSESLANSWRFVFTEGNDLAKNKARKHSNNRATPHGNASGAIDGKDGGMSAQVQNGTGNLVGTIAFGDEKKRAFVEFSPDTNIVLASRGQKQVIKSNMRK